MPSHLHSLLSRVVQNHSLKWFTWVNGEITPSFAGTHWEWRWCAEDKDSPCTASSPCSLHTLHNQNKPNHHAWDNNEFCHSFYTEEKCNPQRTKRTWKESKHFVSEISIIHIFCIPKKTKPKNEILQWYCYKPAQFCWTFLPCLPGEASLQHILLPLPCNIDLQQFKKTFEPRVHPHWLWAATG